MSDQQAHPDGDTPAVAGPDQAPGTAQDLRPPEGDPNDPYEKRYNEVRLWADRVVNEKHQRAEELERQYEQAQEAQQWYEIALTTEDEATRRQALERLGYQIPEQEDPEPTEYEYDDPTGDLRRRQEALEERVGREEEARAEAIEGQILRDFVDDQLDQLQVTDEDDRNWILAQANNRPINPPPGVPVRAVPDIQGAYEAFQAWETKRQKQWAQTKRAPFVMPGGQTATEAPDLSTHEGRVANMLRKAQEMSDQG